MENDSDGVEVKNKSSWLQIENESKGARTTMVGLKKITGMGLR